MRRMLLITTLLVSSLFSLSAQRSKVVAAYQLIGNGKYEEAKEAIEEAVEYDRTWSWARTWYTRGLLCQTAYEEGKKENDKKKYELYPDQLYEAYISYRQALVFDKSEKLNNQVAPNYVQLANDFLELGKENYKKAQYEEALRAFEHALAINESSLLSLETDSSLLYNTALAAYNSKDWYKAGNYLNQLNTLNYSVNIPHLQYKSYMEQGDTSAAVNALSDGVERYNYDEKLVLLLSDFLFQNNETGQAMSLLDSAENKNPENPVFPYTKGLINQKTGNYDQAIEDYENSISQDPEKIEAYSNIANCYFNMAVDIDEKARKISSNRLYQIEKAKAVSARESAIEWLEKAYDMDPLNEQVRKQLNQLYQYLLNDSGD